MTELLHVTIGQLLEQTARVSGDKEAVVYHDLGLRYTYREFEKLCREVARGFMSLGIEQGDHMAIWATNKPEWLISQFSTAKMGGVLVTVNTNYRRSELEYLLQQSDATTIILMEEYRGHSFIETLYEVVPELRESKPGQLQSKRLPKLKNVIVLGENRYPGTYSWDDVLKGKADVTEEMLDERMSNQSPSDVINMQYTSGTTGFPKGVMLTHSNLVNNGLNIAGCMKLTNEDRLCIPVPFFHCFGCVLGTMACVSVGATMVPIEEFNPSDVLRTVAAEKCTGLHGVPTMFIAELNLDDFDSYDVSTLRTGIMAGSNCPIEVMKNVVEKLGMSEITITYGQTESSPGITMTRTDDPIELRVSSVGRALPNVEVKIVDPTTGEEVPSGTQGELCTRGYHVMKGYYKNPEATQEAIDHEGWLHTGDLAVMDGNGYCKITGRLKDMIIRGGENVYPREVEEFLYQHPAILDVQVIGVPDKKYGEVVMAWIILKEGETLTEEEVKEYCKGQISHFKIPRYVQFTKEYPMTASGKIQKFKLKEQSIDVISESTK
ncbi:AMP-binding domain protein [Peribacillus asahii]|uniref:AMP-binding domain protein n=1 Tax=Peribacillus asahii TaxID=228899 RepID=A0A3T0KQ91_9BACI|nr:AMP-binding protein [Peribacillus asahii]AZV42536.1 AMP-binding domain protein [Peribacillus asahii]